MARQENQKLKLLAVKEYLEQYSDQDHPVTVRDIVAHLEGEGIPAERKSVYRDLQLLMDHGCDIVCTRGNTASYFLNAGTFDLAELKLLADAVTSSKFLTERKSAALLKKLGKLTSRWQAVELRRSLVVTGRVKSMNESVFYNVDAIHEAIRGDSQIRFRYFEWDRNGERVFRKGFRTASPLALRWDDSNYYLIAYTAEHGITHFRVDKMDQIRSTGEPRVRNEQTESLDLASYGKEVFGMFNGRAESVLLRFENRLAGVVIDRFGRDLSRIPDGEAHFLCRAEVMVSPMFFGWLASFGTGVQLLSPERVVEEYRESVAAIAALYQPAPPPPEPKDTE